MIWYLLGAVFIGLLVYWIDGVLLSRNPTEYPERRHGDGLTWFLVLAFAVVWPFTALCMAILLVSKERDSA